MNQASEPVTQISYIVNSLQGAIASAERVFRFLDEKEEIPNPVHAQTVKDPKGNVSFEHVRFGYNVENILMKDISFTAKAGSKMAIVGPTGAGKTTLVWLFGGTIRENIAYSKPDTSSVEIYEAAKAARADHFIRTMPDGYETVLSDEIASLSAGQRQLLTIARAILADPTILILDEATSSVDTRTELEIQKAMDALMKGRTSFIIAHRLSTIRDADHILVMNHGTIIEQGNHEELMKLGKFYADLYNSQFALATGKETH